MLSATLQYINNLIIYTTDILMILNNIRNLTKLNLIATEVSCMCSLFPLSIIRYTCENRNLKKSTSTSPILNLFHNTLIKCGKLLCRCININTCIHTYLIVFFFNNVVIVGYVFAEICINFSSNFVNSRSIYTVMYN